LSIDVGLLLVFARAWRTWLALLIVGPLLILISSLSGKNRIRDPFAHDRNLALRDDAAVLLGWGLIVTGLVGSFVSAAH
jgi:hypothetical protein